MKYILSEEEIGRLTLIKGALDGKYTSIRSHIYFDKDPHFVDNKTRPLEGTRNDEDSTSEQGSSFRE
ncbi:hypothetical protein ACYULU_15475, partial [Breznakiellaceae bacterium SP9]